MRSHLLIGAIVLGLCAIGLAETPATQSTPLSQNGSTIAALKAVENEAPALAAPATQPMKAAYQANSDYLKAEAAVAAATKAFDIARDSAINNLSCGDSAYMDAASADNKAVMAELEAKALAGDADCRQASAALDAAAKTLNDLEARYQRDRIAEDGTQATTRPAATNTESAKDVGGGTR